VGALCTVWASFSGQRTALSLFLEPAGRALLRYSRARACAPRRRALRAMAGGILRENKTRALAHHLPRLPYPGRCPVHSPSTYETQLLPAAATPVHAAAALKPRSWRLAASSQLDLPRRSSIYKPPT